MQVTETSADGLKREFKIVVPADDLETQVTDRLGELGRAIQLPGFRPGKVPMQILRRRYGAAVRGEVLEGAVQDGSAEAIRERNLRPALPPKIEIVNSEEGRDLEYTMSVELLPDLPEINFSELELERLVVDVPDEDVDKAVERLAEQQRKSEPVERAAEKGDVVVVNYVGRIDGVEFPGGKGDNVSIELGSGQFIPGFEDQLIGAATGEERKVNVTFPADYGAGEIAGKEAVFDVTVKEVRERQPAKIDDELAEQVGLDTLDELRQEIRQRMQHDYADATRQRLKRALLDKLAERVDFPVPPGMLDIEFDTLWRQYQDDKKMRPEAAAPEPRDASAPSVPDEAAGAAAAPEPAAAAATTEAPAEGTAEGDEDEEKTRAEFRQIAERRVRLGLLLAEVGRNNNINVTQEELNQALAREARRFAGYERQILDLYRKSPELANRLRAPIFEDKVVDFIVELAKVNERRVSPRELMSLPEGEDGASETGSAATA